MEAINDLELLRFCYRRVTRKELPITNNFPGDKYVCFGEYGIDNEPLWVVVLHSFTDFHDCHLDFTLNLKGLFSRKLFMKMAAVTFDYAFQQAKLKRCTAHVRASNTASLRLVKAWGFQEEGYKRLGFEPPDTEDMHLFGMLATECHWIRR